MPEVASQTLDFVGRELNLTLAEARTALENYVEQPDNVSLLERCTQELHQVQGVLRVLEDNLMHLSKVRSETMFRPIHGPSWGYRYRARLTVRNVVKKGGVLVGFHERKSSFVADMTSSSRLSVP